MSAKPNFFATPLRYLRWAHVAKPAIFYSVLVGSFGPVLVFTVPPLRRRFGDTMATDYSHPYTYPVPTGPRKEITGYDD
ncbi:NADH-ubiquinone oxidoreductase 9.5 kDa subunit [Amylocarpus encephaloides]|uniref:NADH-ubiquinone oxidoreductase 9.5 kDa subunit n=1 Tax=Amylocarpus encephaloides TaxID=45428 RepID=A0A9P8C8N5_9HELO|nr:NADH-ubiquinone oxidoreductase 9.5 kDa subunit [Amylocarpus encephaloides]